MESLTFWYDGYHGVCNHPDCANRNNVDNCPLADEEKCESLRDIFDRLAAYENTGLTPERCAELAQSEKDGRLKKKKERNDYWLVMAVIMAIFIPISYYYCGLAGAITPVAGAAIYGYLYYRGL